MFSYFAINDADILQGGRQQWQLLASSLFCGSKLEEKNKG